MNFTLGSCQTSQALIESFVVVDLFAKVDGGLEDDARQAGSSLR